MKVSLKLLYWLIPLVLVLLQAILIFHSNTQVRFEEVDEGIRESFFFRNHLMWASQTSNIGWYGSVAFFNQLFGFSLYGAKYLRLALFFVSMFCLAAILRKYLSEKASSLVLLTVGLSPTILFFNTLQAPFGIDLDYFPICLFLMLGSKKKYLNLVMISLSWILAMIAWLSYPSFIFYLPVIAWIFYKRSKGPLLIKNLLASLVAFLAPLVLFAGFITDKSILFNSSTHQGLFTAGGTLIFDADHFTQTILAVLTNLFVSATSYHFEVNQVDFSLIFPVLGILVALILPFKFSRKLKEIKFPTLLTLTIALANIFLISFTLDGGVPGGRRNTPLLFSLYALLAISFYILDKKILAKNTTILMVGLLALILVHHIVVYPLNLTHISDPSGFKVSQWFDQYDQLKQQLLDKDLYLDCHQNDSCEYGQIYSALSADCSYNKLTCHKIYGYIDSGYSELTLDTWKGNNFER